MIPVTSQGRIDLPGGSWTNKMGGEFQEGDSSTKFFFEGRADIKELGGHLKVVFKDITVVKRPLVVTDALLETFKQQYQVERKIRRENNIAAYGDAAEDSDDDEEELKAEKEHSAIQRMVADEKIKSLVIPKLQLFLTTKKPKTRMIDAHKTGCKIFLGANASIDPVFGKEGATLSYEANLRDIQDISGFQGIVALKLPPDEPVTEEVVIYSLIKLQSYRSMKKRTIDSLHLSEITEELNRILAEGQKGGINTVLDIPANMTATDGGATAQGTAMGAASATVKDKDKDKQKPESKTTVDEKKNSTDKTTENNKTTTDAGEAKSKGGKLTTNGVESDGEGKKKGHKKNRKGDKEASNSQPGTDYEANRDSGQESEEKRKKKKGRKKEKDKDKSEDGEGRIISPVDDPTQQKQQRHLKDVAKTLTTLFQATAATVATKANEAVSVAAATASAASQGIATLKSAAKAIGVLNAATAGGGGGLNPAGSGSHGKQRTAIDNIKALSQYRKLASKAFLTFDKLESDDIDYFLFMKMLNFLDIFLIQVQAIRIFNAVDVHRSGYIGISEFENSLMIMDLLGSSGINLVVLDVFDSLKGLPLAVQLENSQVGSPGKGEKKDVATNGNALKSGTNTNKAPTGAASTADGKDKGGGGSKTTTTTTATTTLGAKGKTRPPIGQQAPVRVNPAAELLASCGNPMMGLDYSAFVEGVQMLGVPQNTEDEVLREAFCFAAGIKAKDDDSFDSRYLNLTEFRKGWLSLADLEDEMKKRGMKYESGVFAQARNRDRITRSMVDYETVYLTNLSRANLIVEGVKIERRIKKDKQRNEQEAHRAKLLHEANKFIAVRGQEKRLLIKKEQEEKSKKRAEDKVLRNKLLLRQQENINQKNREIAESNKIKEKLRIAEIKALGLDKIDKSVQNLRKINPDMYNTPEAQTYLQYAVLIDFSHNIIDTLPEDNFLYWMTECKKLKFSGNRLRHLTNDLDKMVNLEILELDTNRIEWLPEGISMLTNLQRLDISNNQLTALPHNIGSCGALRYFCAHSNQFTFIPTTIGQCFKLEYIDVSRNILMELPEDLSYCSSLTHLDVNANRLGVLPHQIGSCSKLGYIDCSTNQLTCIPNSVSELRQLEYMNCENNNIVLTKNCFNHCLMLKSLNMPLPLEIGLLTLLQELKLNRNNLVTLPAELGSCVRLQRLELPYNQIEGCLPDTIGLIHSLKYLDISFNPIDALPRSIIGLKNLTELRAERCQLFEFPDTITYLDTLEIIEVPNNKFHRFPLELQHMVGLKTLNLANNEIALVQRNINVMTKLECLDLSRNRLLALPVEFTDIFESVAVVELHSNPWTLLPNRWGKLWPGTHATQGPKGYSLSEAVDFLYGMRAIYDTAEKIWDELGVFHYAGRLSFEDFVHELRVRLPKSWHDGLIEYAKHVYFKARESGVFPRWYALDNDTIAETKLRLEADAERREKNVQRSRDELRMRNEVMNAAYGGDLSRKMRQVNDLAVEHERKKDIVNHSHMVALFEDVKKKERISAKRIHRREQRFERQRELEMSRLKEILEDDKEGRELEKAERKKNRQILSPIRYRNV